MGILSAVDLVKTFPARGRDSESGKRHEVRAVQGVSLDVAAGTSLAIVGESGSGKTTLARMLLGIEHPSSGAVLFRGESLAALNRKQMRDARVDLQMIFQDPYDSLDPRLSVAETVATALLGAGRHLPGSREVRVREALELAGLSPVQGYLGKRPDELSGGQRQRVAIARALVTRPAVIVADEPVSMLDVSIQAGVLNTLIDAQRETGTSYVVITHDLGVARYMSDQVAVMFAGRIVEFGDTETVLANPAHPYTALLFASAAHEPRLVRTITRIPAAPVASIGCPYAARCARADDRCRSTRPELSPVPNRQSVACFHPLDRTQARPIRPASPASEQAQPVLSGPKEEIE